MNKIALGPGRSLCPMPTVLVGALVQGKPNFMTAAFVAMVNAEPPVLAVGLRPARYTLEGIQASGGFSVNIPSAKLVKETDFCGLYSGRKADKSGLFTIFYDKNGTAPMIEECPLNLECRLIQTVGLETHQVCFGQILQIHASPDCLTEGKPDPVKVDPIIYSIDDNKYWRLGEFLGQAFNVGKGLKKDKT